MKEEKFLISHHRIQLTVSDTENKGYDSTSKNRRVILERFDTTDQSKSSLKALQGCK